MNEEAYSDEDFLETLAGQKELSKVQFATSEFYRYEVDKFSHKNRNRGSDKVSLFNRYSNDWSHNPFLQKVHRMGY